MYDKFGGLTATDLQGWSSGGDTEAWKRLGAHVITVTDDAGQEISGVRFAVWAPNARGVRVMGSFNYWNGESHTMEMIPDTGVWCLFVPGIGEGEIYKYEVWNCWDQRVVKVDPMAQFAESAPHNGSIVYHSRYPWHDEEWVAKRAASKPHAEPISIYEIHLGSWRPGQTYHELADSLTQYVTEHGFTHVELMPVAEHPFVPSWGYQVTNYFAPQSRLGCPDDLRYLIDRLHQAGVGVIIDWVPGHFPKDEWALGRFDGTGLYEHEDPRQGEHQDWGTYIFNYSRAEVKSFLVSNALYWIKEFHVDGLRVDAVASMLYLDYSRQPGQWVPNKFGGNENLEAIDLIRYVNSHLYQREPGIIMIAEESTSFPGVTARADHGGLGFGFKWNMGWMNDSLRYIEREPAWRNWHHNDITFGAHYAFSENFILPISHDEVVHGKGSMVNKVPQDYWRKFATLRAFYAYQWAFPGKQLVFMGQEFAQWREFSETDGLDWQLKDMVFHAGMRRLIARLNELYRASPSLFELDNSPNGFSWINGGDAEHATFSWVRYASSGEMTACVVNFSSEPHNDYKLGLPLVGQWEEILNTDDPHFDGDGLWQNTSGVHADAVEGDRWSAMAHIKVPPLGAVWLRAYRSV